MSAELDDTRTYQQYDPQNMLARIDEMPEQCLRAWRMALEFELPRDYAGVNKVVILGMGGSAIGGDLVGSLAPGEAKIPIITNRGYDLPAFVDAQTLVVASSYSGKTEETLSAFEQALATPARKLVITTGGTLKSIAEAKNVPVFTFDYKAQPRAALSYSLLPLICFLQKLGMISDKSGEVSEMVETLRRLSGRLNRNSPQENNPAKQLARNIHGFLPVVYGAGVLAEVAHRWKTQFNENSKAWAFYEVFSELNHNAVVGYEFPADLAQKALVVMLYSNALSERIKLRYQVTRELLGKAGIRYEIVEAESGSPLNQMMSLVLFGDYVTYYLALLYHTDPTPVKVIDYLKDRLAKA